MFGVDERDLVKLTGCFLMYLQSTSLLKSFFPDATVQSSSDNLNKKNVITPKRPTRKGGKGARLRRTLAFVLKRESVIDSLSMDPDPSFLASLIARVKISKKNLKTKKITLPLREFHALTHDTPTRPSRCTHPFSFRCDVYPLICPEIRRECTHRHYQACHDFDERHRYIHPSTGREYVDNAIPDDDFSDDPVFYNDHSHSFF